MNLNNKTFTIFILAFGLPGLGFLIGGVFAFTSTQNFLDQSVSANGTVIDLGLRYSGNSRVYYPIIKFTDESGQEIEFRSSFGSNPPAYQVGEKVSILYIPDNPDQARISSFISLWFLTLLFLGMGTIFTGIGLIFLYSLITNMRK